ncbi:MAG: CinA family nicotinamide mononucleotide deamidase-related protein [Planctomycetota bacterium]|nr:CinA family nicotinamide mononucleotide deamidase-related protein [Planctomycetota bacterium]
MNAEIIAVGTELTTGAKLDTNSQWLSLKLAEIGIPVIFHTTVADDMNAMLDVLTAARRRSDVVIVSGGLGPTYDDLTREAFAKLAGVELELHQPSLDFIRSFFASRKREMPERNAVQAHFPSGSRPIANPRGTAPGIWMFIAVPGVPSEMKRMYDHEILPRLPHGELVIRRRLINMFGVGESHAEELLGDITRRQRDPEVGITAHEGTISLRIVSQGSSATECDAKIEKTEQEIRRLMGHYIFGVENEELEDIVLPRLVERGQTLSTVEIGTGGLLAHRLTSLNSVFTKGPPSPVRGGTILIDTKLPGKSISAVQTVWNHHHDDALAIDDLTKKLAEACRADFETDFALAVAPFPQHDPDRDPLATPITYVALASNAQVQLQEIVLLGDPAIHKSRVAKTALNILRLVLR